MGPTVLLVGSGVCISGLLAPYLAEANAYLQRAASAAEAWNLLSGARPDLLIVSQPMCDLPGPKFAGMVKEQVGLRRIPLFLLHDQPTIDDRYADATFALPAQQCDFLRCVASVLARAGSRSAALCAPPAK